MKRKNVTTEMMKGYISESLLLLMANKEYADITIGEITRKAGVHRSTYYRNFDTKESIIEFFLTTKIMYEYLDDYSKLSKRSQKDYLRTILDCFYRYKKELLLIHKSNLSYHLLNVLNQVFEERLGKEALPLTEHYKRYFQTGGIYNFCLLWFSTGMNETPEEMTDIALSCFPNNKAIMFLEGT
jgi:AcrR family transcriptional regulator